jgi:hypothetical protein
VSEQDVPEPASPQEADPTAAWRLARAMQALAGEPPGALPSAARMDELLHEALRRNDALEWRSDENLHRRRTRWKVLLRRSLFLAASAYRRLLEPITVQHDELVGVLREQGLERLEAGSRGVALVSAVALAERLVPAETLGLRSILVLGPAAPIAVALAHLTGQRVFLAPWSDEAPDEGLLGLELLDLDLRLSEPLAVGRELPYWLGGRFQSVLVRPHHGGLFGRAAIAAAEAAMEQRPGRRLYWTGHPGRHLDYFGMCSILAQRGLLLESLTHDLVAVPLDPDFSEQLLADMLVTPEAEELLDPEPLADLFAVRQEHEHLHCFRPAEELVLHSPRLALEPLHERDLGLCEAWLTPQLCGELGFDEGRPWPGPEKLRRAEWYPGHEWWLARTAAGEPLGLLHLALEELWTRRTLSLAAVLTGTDGPDGGLREELVQLGLRRAFEQLGAQSLQLRGPGGLEPVRLEAAGYRALRAGTAQGPTR